MGFRVVVIEVSEGVAVKEVAVDAGPGTLDNAIFHVALLRLAKGQSFRTQVAAASCETFLNRASRGDDAPRRIDVRTPDGGQGVSSFALRGLFEGVAWSHELAEFCG